MVEMITSTKEQTTNREVLLTSLYQEVFPTVATFVHQHGGDFEDAKDIFQEALVIYYEKALISPQIDNDEAYLFGVARFLWFQRHRRRVKYTPIDDAFAEQLIDEEPEHPSAEKLLQFLSLAGKKCMDMLKAFYYDKLPVEKLASLFGFSSERSATVQKYKCLEKVRDKVKEKNIAYEDFIE